MADFTTTGLEEVADLLYRMDEAATRAVPKMLKAGADVLIAAQQAEAKAMGIVETAGFIKSIKATKVKGDNSGKYVEVYPQGKAKHGNDREGDKGKVRFATIGFINEYGKNHTPARPYMKVANMKSQESVSKAMVDVWEQEQKANG